MTTNAPTSNGYSTSISTTPNNYRESTTSFRDNGQNYIDSSAYEIITVFGDSGDKATTPKNHLGSTTDTALCEDGKITDSSTHETIRTPRITPLLSSATLIAALFLALSSCSKDNPITPEPIQPDTEAPKITRYLPNLEIPESGAAVSTGKSKVLTIGGKDVAKMRDNKSETGTRTVYNTTTTGNPVPVEYITDNGEYKISVKDDAGNITKDDVIIKIKKIEGGNEPLISGLEYLQNLGLQVDGEYDLLKGITFSNDVDKSSITVRIEFDGTTTKINNPNNWIAEYPGPISFTIKYKTIKDGKEHESDKINTYIDPLEYDEPYYETANPLDNFSWTNSLKYDEEKNFWLWPLTGSEIASQLPLINGDIIFQGETSKYIEQNIGVSSQSDVHGDNDYIGFGEVIGNIEDITIFGHYGDRNHLNQWRISQSDPEKLHLVSSAPALVSGTSMDEINSDADIPAYTSIINSTNWLTVEASTNKTHNNNKVYNENISPNGDGKYYYNTTSINSNNRYKVVTTGYYPGNDYYTNSTNQVYGNKSKMTYGYDLENNKNVSMFTHGGVDINNKDRTDTYSSPTPSLIAGEIRNAITMIESSIPLISHEAAIELLFTEYLKKEPIIYMDENGNTTETGAYHYCIDFEKLTNKLILHLDEIENLQLNTTNLTKIEPLNDMTRIYGKGIGFIGDDGYFYTFTDDNKDLYDKDNVYFNPEVRKKQGGEQDVILTYVVLNRQGKKLSNTTHNIRRPVKR